MKLRLLSSWLFQRWCAHSGRNAAVETVLRTVSWRESANGLCQGMISVVPAQSLKSIHRTFSDFNNVLPKTGIMPPASRAWSLVLLDTHSLRCGLEECRQLPTPPHAKAARVGGPGFPGLDPRLFVFLSHRTLLMQLSIRAFGRHGYSALLQ